MQKNRSDFRKKFWNERKGKKRIRKSLLSPVMPSRVAIAFFAVFCLFLTLSALIFIFFPVSNVFFDNEKASALGGSFLISVRGNSFTAELPAVVNAGASEKYTLCRRLKAETDIGNSIVFYTRQSWVSVRLDDETVYSADRNENLPIRLSPGSYWHFFRLPEDYDGKLLSVEIEPLFSQYGKITPVIYIGTKASFLYMVVKQGLASVLFVIPVLNLGLLLIIVSFFVKKSDFRKRAFRLGLFGTVISVWSLLESRMTQLFFGNIVYASFVLFFCFYLIPMLATALLLTFSSLRKRKEFHVLFWVSFAVFVCVHLLRLLDVFYYVQMIFLVHGLLLVLFALMIRCYIGAVRNKTAADDEVYIYKAVIMLGFFCLIDILSFYFFSVSKVGNASRIGMLLFLLYIGIGVIRQIGRDELSRAKARIYHELAFRDVMTGLFNRTAFERYLSGYRRHPEVGRTIVLIFDMNHLKTINDVYGHGEGDTALKIVAECLKISFKEKCNCYRIGGDEFCIITHGLSEREVADNCNAFRTLIDERSSTLPYSLSVAGGFSVVREEGIDRSLRQADEAMYLDKLQYSGLFV